MLHTIKINKSCIIGGVFRCRTHATGATPAFASGHDASGTPRKRTRHTAHPHPGETGQGTVNIQTQIHGEVSSFFVSFFSLTGRVYWLLTAMTRRLRKRLFHFVQVFSFLFFLFHITTTTATKFGRLDGSLRQRLLTKIQKKEETIFKVSRLSFSKLLFYLDEILSAV